MTADITETEQAPSLADLPVETPATPEVPEVAPVVKKERKPRVNYVHIPFDSMKCPYCERFGKIPGIKRHVKSKHGVEVLAQTTFPPIRTRENLQAFLSQLSPADLEKVAANNNATDASVTGLVDLLYRP